MIKISEHGPTERGIRTLVNNLLDTIHDGILDISRTDDHVELENEKVKIGAVWAILDACRYK